MKKRILATVLAAVMALSLLPMSALAAPRYEEEVVAETPVGEEVQEGSQKSAAPAPAAPAELEEAPAAAELLAEGETGYNGAALPTGPDMSGTTVTVTPENAQYTLDGAYGSINGKTIVFGNGEYPVLELGRATKYAGSGTLYYNMHWNGSSWVKDDNNPVPLEELNEQIVKTYHRPMTNVTFKMEDGAHLSGFTATDWFQGGNPGPWDYVRDVQTNNNNPCYYFTRAFDGLTFDGLTINGQISFWSGMAGTTQKNITIKNCKFIGDVDKMEKNTYQAIRLNSESGTSGYENLNVLDNKVENFFQGMLCQNPNGATVSGNTITNTTHNAIALQGNVNGTVEVSGNTISGAKDRAIRFGNIGENAEIVVSNNIAIDSGDDAGEIMKAGTIAPTASITIAENNNWGEGKKVNEGMLPAAEVNGESYLTLQGAIDAADGKTVTLLKDIYLEATVNVGAGKTTTLDLNGYKITVKQSNGRSLYAIDNYGTLTIDDTSEGKNGKIIARGTENYGTMYMKGGAIESCDSNGGGAAVWNEGHFEMTGGKLAFTGQKSGNDAGSPFTNAKATATAHITGGKLVSNYSLMFVNKGKVTVENISVENSSSYWMAFKVFTGGELDLKNVTVHSQLGGSVECAGGTVNLEGCTFIQDPATEITGEGHTSSAVSVSTGGVVNVKGGTYTAAGFGAYVFNSGGTINIEDGAFTGTKAVLKADTSPNAYASKINVKNGTFTGEIEIAQGEKVSCSISGGTFDRDVSDYCAPGLVATAGDDGKYTIGLDPNPEKPLVAQVVGGGAYETLAEAVAAAANGGEVKLLKDVENGTGIIFTADKNLTVDFNGKTYTVVGPMVGSTGTQTNGFQLLQGGTVTLKNGMVIFEAAAKIGVKNYANLTIENLDITAKGNVTAVSNCGTLLIKGSDTKISSNAQWSVTTGNYNRGVIVATTIEAGDIDSVAIETPLWEVGGATVDEEVTVSIAGGRIGKVGKWDWRPDYGDRYENAPVLSNPKLTITGGTFTVDVSAYCADGFRATQNADGTWSVAVIPAPAPTPSVTYYTLTIRYVDAEGNEVAPSVTRRLSRSSRYNVASPEVEGMVPDQAAVSGVMGREDLTVTVTYTANEQLVDPDVPLAGGVFIDVTANDWFAAAVSSVYAKELMVGVTANTFAPKALTTRGMVATILHRMESEPNAAAADFSDVLDGAWYAPAVNWANEAGLMIGAGNGAFGAEDHITREQLALTFYRYAQFKGQDVTTSGDLSAFADGAETSDWAKEAMTWAVESGLFQGKGQNILDPKADLTRAELAAILDRFFAEEK